MIDAEPMLSENFTRAEMECPCCFQCIILPDFMFRLQRLRTKMDRPMYVNSGFRCPLHNTAIGGAKKSRHLEGIAADISVIDWTSAEKYECLALAIELGFKGIGIYERFFHFDMRPGAGKLWASL